ncbi:SCO7613 C-terminal domain-containing membrane protein [Modestobacter versicolor]|uniref:SCO7613 C-terminal domain-containing membrane protein n=1 Tax=Modestobacter versicolor TaxID=429133 RepID=UPI0034DE8E7E
MSQGPEVQYPPPLGVPVPPPPAPPEDAGLRRVSPQQVLLVAGAVAVVVAGTASVGLLGWVLTTALAAGTAATSLWAGRRGLRTSEETLAVATVVLLVAGDRADPGRASALALAAFAAAYWLLGRLGRRAVTWPVAAWVTAQLAVLTAVTDAGLDGLGQVGAVLGTAVAGTLVAQCVRRTVAAVVLSTTALWWVTGVVLGTSLVWTTTSPATAAGAAVLLVAAAAGLLALRRRGELRPLLGPRPLVPVLAGAVTGAALAGVLQSTGAGGVPAAGYLGLVTAALVAVRASPRPDSVVRPAGLALACTATALSVVQLLADSRWNALALLLVAAALPAVLVAARQPTDRPGALPVGVGCLAGAALLAEAGGSLASGWAGPLLLVLAVAALAVASLERHQRAEVPLAVSAVVVGVVAVAHVGRTTDLLAAGALAVLGAALVGYSSRTGRRAARMGGCAALVVAVWLADWHVGVEVPEAWTLPLAAGLLLYSGRRLATAPSWSSWGPALGAAFGPSVLLALVQPALLRVLLVVAAATLTTTVAAGRSVRAPFLVGAASLVVVGVGRLVAVLPPPALVAFAVAGAALLAAGTRFESRRRQAREPTVSLADMR